MGSILAAIPSGLKRHQQCGDLHSVTFSGYRRESYLAETHARDSLEKLRRKYRFAVVGYVVMPEHLHLLLSEPRDDTVRGRDVTKIQLRTLR
jgi:putative transposase